jgi:C1A family cysteine protease
MATRKFRLNKYGWRADKPDYRDLRYAVPQHLAAVALPSEVDLRPGCPAPYDQNELGSCTSQAIAGNVHYELMKQNPAKAFQPSPMFIYYNERVIENSVNEDAGAEIRDGIKSLVRWGVCPEQYHPYVISKFKTKPSKLAYKQALPHRVDKYLRVTQDLEHLKSCLADKNPIVFGFAVYESFESDEVAKTGVVQMPGRREKDLGGHAVLAVGYRDYDRRFIVRNSWGINWGINGYFTIPYEYVLNDDLAADFWSIKVVPT